MRMTSLPGQLAVAILLLLTLLPEIALADERCMDTLAVVEDATVRLAADRIDSALDAVADSTRALGDTYRRLALAQLEQATPDSERWLAQRTTRGNTTGLRSWPADLKAPPLYQEAYPAFYSYNGAKLDDQVLRQLDLFKQLVPTFRAAYESFPFSWVYVTTVDDAMMIYPYLPIEQAINNGTPTQTPYYRAADFRKHAVGWTPPYLDLVGAGMMITASYPIYDKDSLLGVVSRDITLKQLSKSVLKHLTDTNGSVALIVDSDGLGIDATDPALAAEIDQVNARAGAAVLYYRSADGMERITTRDAIASSSASTNTLIERVLAKADGGNTVRLDLDGRRVLAAPIERTAWLLVLIRPDLGRTSYAD
ncbi:MAG: hypothetical protein PVI28_10935 [Gammaproteobacteria bacterium]|jgi:hypothetical protein